MGSAEVRQHCALDGAGQRLMLESMPIAIITIGALFPIKSNVLMETNKCATVCWGCERTACRTQLVYLYLRDRPRISTGLHAAHGPSGCEGCDARTQRQWHDLQRTWIGWSTQSGDVAVRPRRLGALTHFVAYPPTLPPRLALQARDDIPRLADVLESLEKGLDPTRCNLDDVVHGCPPVMLLRRFVRPDGAQPPA